MKNQATTKEALLTSAIDLLKKYGFDNVTINQICNEVNVTKTAFYYHFKSKDELITEFFSTSKLISNEELLTILSARDYANQVLKIMQIYTMNIVRAGFEMTKEFYRVNLRKEVASLSQKQSCLKETLTMLILRAQEANQIKNLVSAEDLYDSLCYMSNGVCILWAISNGSFDILEESQKRYKNLLMIEQ